ncbi:AraC family transcriptional regulator [Bosea sp. ANAM02]|uniref:helix-turn-helix transcriptional regulator n=1 Tax=Bosea sp. ANAM02 TaxID=2020412 RepID=UPI00140F0CA8|nr:AraC family transcriptional regulator [Bosea sp. ANAM02]BCB20068.1 AraC family transcriptional regulator [Bosea sp. ANAM02]
MIESSASSRDRLSVFFRLFSLSVVPLRPAGDEPANMVIGLAADGVPAIALGARARDVVSVVSAAARIDFEGSANPLMRAMPDPLVVPLAAGTALSAVAENFMAELETGRCGAPLAIDYLGRLILLMVLRHAIEAGAADAGLLAGLAHPNIYPALVAIHEQPQRNWQAGDLAALAGLSRTRFMTLFAGTVGTPPIAYLNGWRLALGRRALARGGMIKTVARQVGYGSAAAFSRAYARHFGSAPAAARASVGRGAASSLTRIAPRATPRP